MLLFRGLIPYGTKTYAQEKIGINVLTDSSKNLATVSIDLSDSSTDTSGHANAVASASDE
jgi:hypothetical protein